MEATDGRRRLFAPSRGAAVAGVIGLCLALVSSTFFILPAAWVFVALGMGSLAYSIVAAVRARVSAAVVVRAVLLLAGLTLLWLPLWQVHGDFGGRLHAHAIFNTGHVH
jgi:hypothetical protein